MPLPPAHGLSALTLLAASAMAGAAPIRRDGVRARRGALRGIGRVRADGKGYRFLPVSYHIGMK